ncbi:hypothetical protein [Glycomyces artemisiae]|uniref:Uncharacterized protein n=1 Tax=Glycomyces artemisiae TaxID=1076443 RepID=A0A2T0UH04_9ACTN|nr:hypothetical protein [Glycomyces artemisiae]PRY57233.1 hypothetical protein B0I28_10780 [Glycomyces artemisiae]
MSDTPRGSAPAVRLAALVLLAAVWTAALLWMWTEGAPRSCFEYTPLADAGSSPGCGERRFDASFALVLAAGPAAGAALWFALRPRGRASR